MVVLFKKQAWILGGFEYLRADTTVETDPGSGGAEFAVDAAAGGELHPYAKMEFGGSGTQTPVSVTNPLPVGGSGAAALGKAEDSVHSSGDVGVPSLFVRRDTPSAGAADGDYAFGSLDANGLLRTNGSGANQPVTDAGGSLTFDTPQLPSALGQDDAAGSLSVVLASDQTLPLPTGAATAAAQGTGNSALAAIQAAVEALDNAVAGNELQVDIVSSALPTGAATAAKQPALGTAGSASADVITVQGVASMTPIQVADNGGSLTVDGTVAVSSLPASTNTLEVVGDVAHDAAAGGNPVLIAARANANEPSAVSADGDATHLWADLLGRLVVQIGHPNPESPVTVNVSSSGNNDVIAAPGAGSLHICKGSIHNRGASDVLVALTDGDGGTARFRGLVSANGGALGFSFGSRGWKLSATTKLTANLGGAVSVDVNVTEYYIAA